MEVPVILFCETDMDELTVASVPVPYLGGVLTAYDTERTGDNVLDNDLVFAIGM